MTPERGPGEERFEEAVIGLLAERGRTTNGDIRAALEGIEALPDRSAGRGRSWLAAAAAVALLVLGGGFVLGRLQLPTFGSGDGRVGRAAFTNDPRLGACEDRIGTTAAQVFEMTHAEWFPLYFPGWFHGAPELQVSDPALVVLGPTGPGPAILGNPRVAGDSSDPGATPPPSFQLCIAIGPPEDATVHDYGWMWFERIVPVLSDADVARAAHLDPDVVADPAAWPFPDRLAPCPDAAADALYIFEASHLKDFAHYFPNSGPNPFGDVDEPAVVVVYRDPVVVRASPDASAALDAGRHDVCAALEVDGAQPDHVLLSGVDISGFHVMIDTEITDPPIVAPGPTPFPEPSLVPVPSTAPAPSWTADLGGQLQCDGPVTTIGGEVPSLADKDSYGGDPETALATFLGPSNPYASLPTDGFRPLHLEDHWAGYANVYRGRIKALIVLSDTTTNGHGWGVLGLRACDASEFDPDVPLTFPVTIWTDAAFNRVSTDSIVSFPGPAHCGYDGSIWLVSEGVLYFRDPKGVMGEWEGHPYESDATLPSAAVDSGYRSGSGELWVVPKGDAYFVTPERTERWPRSTDQALGCA